MLLFFLSVTFLPKIQNIRAWACTLEKKMIEIIEE